MSHFAEIDNNGIVLRVIVSEQDFINSGAVGDSLNWVQTSYNNKFRNKFAVVEDIYDKTKDAFISPQPYDSWTLDSDNNWQAPTAMPNDGEAYEWNEDKKSWEVSLPSLK